MKFSYFWGRKSNKGSDKGRYFDGVDDAVSKEGDRRYYRAGDRRALRDPETDLLLSFCGYLCTDGLDAGIIWKAVPDQNVEKWLSESDE